MNEKTELIHKIAKRLVWALGISVGALVILVILTNFWEKDILTIIPFVVILFGAIGGFVGLQRRLKSLEKEDLILISESAIYTYLAPIVGGILAMLLYIVFLSGLLQGDIFPSFEPLSENEATKNGHQDGVLTLFDTKGDYKDYSKLLFWSFVAGYSEKFVTDIIGQFESKAQISERQGDKSYNHLSDN